MAERSFGTEDSKLTSRALRYARVGAGVGGLAARLLGARFFGLALDRGRHSAQLKAALGSLKGPLMKTAQILATIPDALPAEYVNELRQLQANAPAMGWSFVRRRMRAELGPDWRARFESFGQEAAAAASLGQVHRARGRGGRRLACKLQYPDMLSTVEADLRQLKVVFRIFHHYDRTIDPTEIYRELAARLREELDYRREAGHLRLFGAMLAGEAGIKVPKPLAGLSTGRLLTMSWLEGKPLLDFIAASDDVAPRNRVALHLFRAWYVPFYRFGIIHGDPHPGNYTVRDDTTINLLDLGCVRVFPARFVKGVIDLYFALAREDMALAVHAYESWGFRDMTKERLEALNIWARFLYAPLLEDRPQRITEEDSGLYGARVANRVHRELRRLGGVRPPREFVLMDRVAIGLGSVFMHLKAEINWYRLFHELIEDFDADALAKRQTEALRAARLPEPNT